MGLLLSPRTAIIWVGRTDRAAVREVETRLRANILLGLWMISKVNGLEVISSSLIILLTLGDVEVE